MEIKNSEGQFQDISIAIPEEKNFIVIVGGNNSGKTTFLREVVKTYKKAAYRVDVNRTILKGEGPPIQGYENDFPNHLQNYQTSSDDNYQKNTQILQDYFRLKDKDRSLIIDWYNQYFPNQIYEEREDMENSASSMLLKANGYSITKQGSGMRSTLEIFIKLFDPSVKVLCIDEPELGLEPYLQKYIFHAIKDKASAEKKIIIATHSHHFLDTETIESNYICTRNADGKILLSVATALQPIIFRLLGNTLSSFLLPERVLILEGPSDATYLSKVLELSGKAGYAIHNSRSIGNMSYAMNAITQFLRFNREHLSVYNERMYVIVDRPDKGILVREWEIIVPDPRHQLCILSQNGIEYYYPERILQQIFNTPDSRQQIIDAYIRSDPNGYNGFTISKVELSKLVADAIIADDLVEEGNELYLYLQTLPNA